MLASYNGLCDAHDEWLQGYILFSELDDGQGEGENEGDAFDDGEKVLHRQSL